MKRQITSTSLDQRSSIDPSITSEQQDNWSILVWICDDVIKMQNRLHARFRNFVWTQFIPGVIQLNFYYLCDQIQEDESEPRGLSLGCLNGEYARA